MILALALSANFSLASDLPGPASEPPRTSPPTPAQKTEFDWTGFYVGAHGGLGFDHYGFKYAIEVPGAAFTGTNGIDGFGPVLGLQAGFNYQIPFSLLPVLGAIPLIGAIPGGLVLGVEVDDSWTGIHGDTTGSGVPPTTDGLVTFGGRFANVGTARLRIGYALDRFLFYATGGFAYGVSKTYYHITTATGFTAFGSHTDLRAGIPPHVGAIGFGVEYAITPNLTVRGEYFYDGINARYEVFNPAAGATVGFGTRTAYHIGRIGVNYKFDWPQPMAVVK